MSTLPIVESLEQAPEKGDAVLMISQNFCIPVRNRERAWSVESIGGWSTTAETPAPLSFAPMGPTVNLRRPWEEQAASRCIPIPAPNEWAAPRFVFAPTAEAAIERYHQSDACPFGRVELKQNFSSNCFSSFSEGQILQFDSREVTIGDDDEDHRGGHYLHSLAETSALHALLSEVIAYQNSERSGTRDSRIHKAIQEMDSA